MPSQSFSLVDFVRLSTTNILSDYRAAFRKDELLPNLGEIPKFRLSQFWGTYRGFTKEGPIPDRLWQRFYYPDRDTFPDSNRPDEETDPRASSGRRNDEANPIDYSSRQIYAQNDNEDIDSDAVP